MARLWQRPAVAQSIYIKLNVQLFPSPPYCPLPQILPELLRFIHSNSRFNEYLYLTKQWLEHPKNLGNKRPAEESAADDDTRVSKAARTTKNTTGGKGAQKNGAKGSSTNPKLSPDAFKAKALPLHVILTHTPPSITKAGDINENGDEEKLEDISTAAEVGLIGNLTLLPTSFSTGSYGWKGNKRVTVELQAGDSEDGGREKVQVMLTINATVLGSKPEKPDAKGKKDKRQERQDKEETEEEEDAEVNEEVADDS
ncbi:hypothetical protein BJ912DRAFT_373620 [Pholiota molesta]|nr:hypothetical protein BJ912DRAFT_373620 [Pholiota molesta]